MADEIAEFLRRAAARRAQMLQQQQQAAQQPPQQSAAAPARKVVRAEVVKAEVVQRPASAPRRTRIEEQVDRDIDTRDFAVRAELMADATEQADERLEQHLQEKFDHKLGSLSTSTTSMAGSHPPDQATARDGNVHPVLNMLTNPESVRNAFILGEIFKRPE
jgi:hypothetical protein